jgi:hypothetical protein
MSKINPNIEPKREPGDYEGMIDLWAQAQKAANAERKFGETLSYEEKLSLPLIIQDIQKGFLVAEVNEFNGEVYKLVLENEKSGEQKEYMFRTPLPVVGIPRVDGVGKNISKNLNARTEFVLKILQEPMTNKFFEARNRVKTEYLQNHQDILKGMQELVRQGYRVVTSNMSKGRFLETTLTLGPKQKVIRHAQEIELSDLTNLSE